MHNVDLKWWVIINFISVIIWILIQIIQIIQKWLFADVSYSKNPLQTNIFIIAEVKPLKL